MSKAEDRALKKYPKKIEWVGNQWDGAPFDINSEKRFYYQQGYKEAEKDLELTWEDMKKIYFLFKDVRNEWCGHEFSDEGICREVLKRFKEKKGETIWQM